MAVAHWRRVRWIPRLIARWLGGALIAVGILYVWLLYILTHHRCPGFEQIAGRAAVHPPCGFYTARFFGYLGVSAIAVLAVVGGWWVINRRLRGPR
ncbi:MAG: hypothetical protein M3Q23_14055 [Actinomycetota bacterium]|nr:hypothetical protein [Actinomycetota bacterium]